QPAHTVSTIEQPTAQPPKGDNTMKNQTIAKHMKTAGRLTVINGTQRATISPIAHPEQFALRHGLTITAIHRDTDPNDALNVAVIIPSRSFTFGNDACTVTRTRDAHEATSPDDIDCPALATAQEQLHLAAEILFSANAPAIRRGFLRDAA